MQDIREQGMAGDLGTAFFGQLEVGRAPCSTPRNYGSGRPRGWPFSRGFSLVIIDALENGELLLYTSLARSRCSGTALRVCHIYIFYKQAIQRHERLGPLRSWKTKGRMMAKTMEISTTTYKMNSLVMKIQKEKG